VSLDLSPGNPPGPTTTSPRPAADIRCLILQGSPDSPHFTAGLDLAVIPALLGHPSSGASTTTASPGDASRQVFRLRATLLSLQATLTRLQGCRVPVILAVHGACIGGGVDVACACDVRLCSQDAWFAVKEVDIGIAPDLGRASGGAVGWVVAWPLSDGLHLIPPMHTRVLTHEPRNQARCNASRASPTTTPGCVKCPLRAVALGRRKRCATASWGRWWRGAVPRWWLGPCSLLPSSPASPPSPCTRSSRPGARGRG
jgi:hypothetical protein